MAAHVHPARAHDRRDARDADRRAGGAPSPALATSRAGRGRRRARPEPHAVQDPAYLAVTQDGVPVAGLSVQLRENRWGANTEADVSAVEVLVQDHPFGGASRLAQIVARLAKRSDRPVDEVAREWFARYAEVALVPLLRACAELSSRADRPAEHAARARGRLAGTLRPARVLSLLAEPGGARRHRRDQPRHRRGPVPRQRAGHHQRARRRRPGRRDRPARRAQRAAGARARARRRERLPCWAGCSTTRRGRARRRCARACTTTSIATCRSPTRCTGSR